MLSQNGPLVLVAVSGLLTGLALHVLWNSVMGWNEFELKDGLAGSLNWEGSSVAPPTILKRHDQPARSGEISQAESVLRSLDKIAACEWANANQRESARRLLLRLGEISPQRLFAWFDANGWRFRNNLSASEFDRILDSLTVQDTAAARTLISHPALEYGGRPHLISSVLRQLLDTEPAAIPAFLSELREVSEESLKVALATYGTIDLDRAVCSSCDLLGLNEEAISFMMFRLLPSSAEAEEVILRHIPKGRYRDQLLGRVIFDMAGAGNPLAALDIIDAVDSTAIRYAAMQSIVSAAKVLEDSSLEEIRKTINENFENVDSLYADQLETLLRDGDLDSVAHLLEEAPSHAVRARLVRTATVELARTDLAGALHFSATHSHGDVSQSVEQEALWSHASASTSAATIDLVVIDFPELVPLLGYNVLSQLGNPDEVLDAVERSIPEMYRAELLTRYEERNSGLLTAAQRERLITLIGDQAFDE